MIETPEQYKVRLAAYVEGKDVIVMQRQTPRILAQLIEGIPETNIRLRPAPGKWSVIEILAHIAEDELTSTWRYRQMLEQDGPELVGFNQDMWAILGDYASWDTGEALDMFRLLREANLRLFGRLTPDQWRRHGVHVERGKLTVQELCRHMAAHDVNHIEQIRAIVGRC
jgi:DinB superfamily